MARAAGRAYPDRREYSTRTPSELALFGTAPDTAVTARVSRTPGAVGGKRLEAGVPAFRRPSWAGPQPA